MKKNYTLLGLLSLVKPFKVFYLIIFISLFSLEGFGQTQSNAKEFTIKSEMIEIENSKIKDIEITWDYSAYSYRTNTKLEIEIQPLNGCWNGLDGTDRSEKVIKPIKDISKHPIGKLHLTFAEYNTKCFKWRVKTTNTVNGIESFTDWQFASFL